MKEYIKKIQSKPEHVRKQYLWIYVVLSMVIVGGIWSFSLTNRFGEKKEVAQKSEETGPFKLFGETIRNTVSGVTASVGSIKSSSMEVESNDSGKIIPLEVVNN